jgi:hypothetical protein
VKNRVSKFAFQMQPAALHHGGITAGASSATDEPNAAAKRPEAEGAWDGFERALMHLSGRAGSEWAEEDSYAVVLVAECAAELLASLRSAGHLRSAEDAAAAAAGQTVATAAAAAAAGAGAAAAAAMDTSAADVLNTSINSIDVASPSPGKASFFAGGSPPAPGSGSFSVGRSPGTGAGGGASGGALDADSMAERRAKAAARQKAVMEQMAARQRRGFTS